MQIPAAKKQVSATVPSSTQFELANAAGEKYLIQVSWPLAWEDEVNDRDPVPVFYVLDGNAHFFTLIEAVRRAMAWATSRDAIVVAIGYPDCGHYVFGSRRAWDLTPPCNDYDPPTSWDGKVFTLPHGGANKFLDFIQGPVREQVLSLFPGFAPEREILAGHSFGGLCSLHALFAANTCFDTFIAISPTIWWSKYFLLSQEKRFLQQTQLEVSGKRKPSLYLSYGYYEQYPRKRRIYSDEDYAKRLAHAISLKTKDDIDDMAERMQASARFELVKIKEYLDDDHGSVAGTALEWAVCHVLDPDRFA